MRAAAAALAALLALGGCVLPTWPVGSRVLSPFGVRWRGGPDLHRGVDLEAALGTDVRAMAGGRVRFSGTMRGYGTVVWLDHGRDILSVYAHLSVALVEVGREVQRGEVIARSGQSGDATGPHLHFEVWKRGREVDPVVWLGGFP